MRRFATVLLFGLLLSCRSSQPSSGPVVSFVHITDPHLFEDPAESGDTSAAGSLARERGATLNAEALAALFRAVRGLGGADSAAFLVVTGDFGVDYTWGVADSVGDKPARDAREKVRELQADSAAALFRGSPVRDIYLVPGNNDVADESASGDALARTDRFFEAVQARLDRNGARVSLHNLAACYVRDDVPLSACAADIPGTDVRLAGFPSYSFKNASEAVYSANRPTQEAQIERFNALIARAAEDHKRALVLEHIPALDDPYRQARDRFAAVVRPAFGNLDRPKWSTWNVSPKVFEGWKRAVESPAVLGVLAGHFHDPHKETYVPPYVWSTGSALLPSPDKLMVAPPLASRLQDASPFQARGFGLIRIGAGAPVRRLYWYDAGSQTFRSDALARPPAGARAAVARSLVAPVRSLSNRVWRLGAAIDELNRSALLAVAFIAAFLTVIQIWRIGEGQSELTAAASTAKEKPGSPAPTDQAPKRDAPPADSDSPFTNRFGKTVMAGFGGLAVVTVLSDLANQKDAKAYYVVLFVLLFVLLLLLTAGLRGFVEALRSRLVLERSFDPIDMRISADLPVFRRNLLRFFKWNVKWAKRFWLWVVSWRATVMVFADSAVNVFLGRNRLESTALADEIYRLQWSLVRVADRVREELTGAVQRALAEECNDRCFDESDVRVNISVFLPRRETVRYVSSSRRSLSKDFERRTVAWVATYYRVARWWKATYKENDARIILWPEDGSGGEQLTLKDNYGARDRSDYEAFIVLPVPWGRRGNTEGVRGAIHISFKQEAYLDALFEGLEVKEEPRMPDYKGWRTMLDESAKPCGSDSSAEAVNSGPRLKNGTRSALRQLSAVLRTSIEVLGESLRYFNEAVFENSRPPADVR